MGDGPDPLANYVQDLTVAEALRSFAAGYGGSVNPLRQPRRARGFTDAELVAVALDFPGSRQRSTQKVFVKVLPARDRREPGRHRLALLSNPGFAERHLVGQPYNWYPVGDGRQLMFQEVANGGDPVTTLDELDDAALVRAVRMVLDALLNNWNGAEHGTGAGRPTTQTTVGRFVHRELDDAAARPELHLAARRLGLTDPGAEWLLVDGHVRPNPLRVTEPGSPFHADGVDQIHGFSHGDLHAGNVLVPPQRRGGPDDPNRFWLVDLSRFEDTAPLSRDQLCLLVTTVLRWVAPPTTPDGRQPTGLPPDQADALLRYLVDPTGARPSRLLPVLADLVEAAHLVGTSCADEGGWRPEWRMQRLLSLVSQAQICLTFDSLGDAGRRWCFRLAAEALEAYRVEFHPSVAPPPPNGLPVLPPGGPMGGSVDVPTGGSASGARPGATSSRERELRARFESPEPDPGQAGEGPVPVPERGAIDQAWPVNPAPSAQRQPADRAGLMLAGPVPARGHWSDVPVRPERDDDLLLLAGFPAPAPGLVDGPTSPAAGPSAPPARPRPAHRPSPVDGPPGHGPAREQLTGARSDGVPQPRRPADDAPPSAGAVERHRPWVLPVAVIAVVAGVWLAGVIVSTSGEDRPAPATAPSTRMIPSAPARDSVRTEQEPESTDAGPELADLAMRVVGMSEAPARGRYTAVCHRLWSQDNIDREGDELDTYREYRLWWTSRRSGRQTETSVVDGRRAAAKVSPYAEGRLTAVLPIPAEDPTELRDQLAEWHGKQPAELRDPAGLLKLVARFHRYHLLTPEQRAALLRHLAETPGISYRGVYHDRANRPGLAVSADDGEGFRETLTFGEDGTLLSHETTGADHLLLSYQLFLTRDRTDSATEGRCG